MKQTRKNILRIAFVLALLLVLLAAYAVWAVSREGNRWFSSSLNVTLVNEQRKKVLPGDILDRNGVLLAGSDANGERIWQADETARRSVSHLLGDTRGGVTNGVESFMARYLYGFELPFFEQAGSLITGNKRHGDNVTLTVDAGLSAYIASVFPADASGAAVVMNYKTGEVLAELTFPNFDPLTVDYSSGNRSLFINNAVQLLKAPGSSFKVITAACALENKVGAEVWNYDCSGYLTVGERSVTCAGTDLNAGILGAHGILTLESAFVKSCNSAFGRLALEMGDETLRRTAEQFGFNDNFLFSDIVVENSAYPSQNRTELEIAWTGAGQSAILTTPMHMCMVAASVANGGVMMEPKLLLKAENAGGKHRASLQPKVYRTAMTAETAETLKGYMRKVVTSGTGTAAAVSGYTVCGKTGSSQMDDQENTDAWFIGFIGEEEHPYALSVVVRDAGGGGSVAAPVARRIFTWLLEHQY